MEDTSKRTCCICGSEFEGWGNNLWPIDDDLLHSYTKCYDVIAEIVYKILANGGALRIKDRRVHADDVPAFMMECTLNGIS